MVAVMSCYRPVHAIDTRDNCAALKYLYSWPFEYDLDRLDFM